MKKVIIPLAEGLEEIEAIANIDILRRAGIEVTTVALGDLKVEGAHNITIMADKAIDEVKGEDFDGILLPGGMPGATNLRDDARVIDMVKTLYENGKLVSAICAAPIVLERAGILKNKKATSYLGFESEMPSCEYLGDPVVIDDNIITGKGPGVAFEFALKVVDYLMGSEAVRKLREEMFIDFKK